MKKFWLMSGLAFGMAIIVITLVRVTADSAEPEYQGRPLTGWMADLRSPSPLAQTNAAVAIRQIGSNAVPFLVQMLEAKDSPLKRNGIHFLENQRWIQFHFRRDFQKHSDALQALGIIGPGAAAAMPEIAKHLDDPSDSRRAAYALYGIGSRAIPVLNQALKDRNEDVRAYAVEMLGLLHDSQSVSNLLAMLKDPGFAARNSAILALRQFPGQAGLIVPALMVCLDDPDEDFRENTIRTLGVFGPAARPAMPKLLKMIESKDAHECEAAASVLMKLDLNGTLTNLIHNLAADDVNVRRGAAWALTLFNSSGEAAVPALVKGLKDPDIKVREYAAIALREIGKEAELVVPALMENLVGPDLTLRSITAIALRSFGARAKPAVPAILKLIQENKGNEMAVQSLYNALREIDPAAAAKLTDEGIPTS